MHKIVYLPLDERPCNAKFPAKLLENNREFCLKTAPQEILGDKKTPACHEKIEEFLLRETKDADCLVVSVDTLLYGGIVPSRLHHQSAEELKKRLDFLKVLRERNPKMKIYAFHLLMRCPQYSSSDEEPDYYETCGREIFLTGEVRDRRDLGLDYDAEELKRLEKKCLRIWKIIWPAAPSIWNWIRQAWIWRATRSIISFSRRTIPACTVSSPKTSGLSALISKNRKTEFYIYLSGLR